MGPIPNVLFIEKGLIDMSCTPKYPYKIAYNNTIKYPPPQRKKDKDKDKINDQLFLL